MLIVLNVSLPSHAKSFLITVLWWRRRCDCCLSDWHHMRPQPVGLPNPQSWYVYAAAAYGMFIHCTSVTSALNELHSAHRGCKRYRLLVQTMPASMVRRKVFDIPYIFRKTITSKRSLSLSPYPPLSLSPSSSPCSYRTMAMAMTITKVPSVNYQLCQQWTKKKCTVISTYRRQRQGFFRILAGEQWTREQTVLKCHMCHRCGEQGTSATLWCVSFHNCINWTASLPFSCYLWLIL